RRPPTSTLFPTRRSSDLSVARAEPKRQFCPWQAPYSHSRYTTILHLRFATYAVLTLQPSAASQNLPVMRQWRRFAPNDESGPSIDRKSTRLNSSHVAISY